jgi:glucokinase
VTKFLGLDLGGTNIKICVLEIIDFECRVIENLSIPTDASKGPEYVVNLLAQTANYYINEKYHDVEAVSVAVPGIFNHATGEILLFPNLPGNWENQPMKAPIAALCNIPVFILNDARAFSLAEAHAGQAKGKSPVACIVLGTGVGGGIVIDGKIHLGSTLGAGEIGHQIVNPEGEMCGCGAQGCVETMASASAISRGAGTNTPEEAFARAMSGDRKAIEAFEEAAKWLGIGIANVMAVLSPEIFIIGGGVAQSGDFFLKLILKEAQERSKLTPIDSIKIVPAALGIYAGSIGAALNGVINAGAKFNLISTT